MTEKRNCLVTGGAGFIGSHLCERLVTEGHDVVAVDNFYTGSRDNVRHLLDAENFRLSEHDVCEPFPSFGVRFDRIYNLACPASPIHYQRNPVFTIRCNLLGTMHGLQLAVRHGARFLQASTSEVYGDPEVHPQPETYRGWVNPIGPRACYDAETEILTEDGWTPFPELREGRRVATLTESGRVEYHVPDEIIRYPYVGELLRFANVKFDLCVTPNHRMYVRSKTGTLRFLRADEDRHWGSWRTLTGGTFDGAEVEWMDFGPTPRNAKVQLDPVRMDDWLEFLGYYISEGCVHQRRRVREVGGRDYDISDYNILVAQVDPHGRKMISGCLERLGWRFFDSDDHQFRISSKHLATHLAPLGRSGDKYIPREYLRLSRRQSRILLDALILGDGTRKVNGATYYTKSKRLADDVQELALRSGYAANQTQTPGRDLYRVNIRPPVDAKLVAPERVRYAGNVYCVNVTNHVICVRRSGRTAWCGNCYDEGKRCAETLCFDYHRRDGADIRVARIFNTYGPRMALDDGRVVSNFIVQALRGDDITLYGDGSQTRSFCYVDDLVWGLMALIEHPSETGPMNLGNPEEQSIADMARTVVAATGSKSRIVQRPLPEDDPKQRNPDITKARTVLGFAPTTAWAEGLGRTVPYFRACVGK